ncbi:MAG: DUF547 domain-containing protein [Flavobacteriaceae bacterium]
MIRLLPQRITTKASRVTILILLFWSPVIIAQDDANTLARELLKEVRDGRPTLESRERLAQIPMNDLIRSLDTDTQKKTFWINVYNAHIQLLLTENPELYRNRDDFFKKNRITIAGQLFSFDLIEHGILRRSQLSWGLGIFGKWFPNSLEKKLRVSKVDYRIHFALNCGAKDCPPVAVYHPQKLETQLEYVSKNFLEKTTQFDSLEKTARVTSLFSWFRGDFGFSDGVTSILRKYGAIPLDATGISVTYAPYDWTLDLGHFLEVPTDHSIRD